MFQRTINQQPPLAIEGDFASANPRASTLAGEAALVADPLGLTVGRFAWISGNAARNFGTGLPAGFVHRELIGAITAWLGNASMLLTAGTPVTLFNEGDFWVRCGNVATPGQKAFADLGNGSVVAAAAGGSVVAAAFTASIAGNTMTVTAISAGAIAAGQSLTGAGVLTGQAVVAQLTGTAGGVGTYSVLNAQTLASQAIAGGAAVETQFVIRSAGLAGELVKISTWGKQ